MILARTISRAGVSSMMGAAGRLSALVAASQLWPTHCDMHRDTHLRRRFIVNMDLARKGIDDEDFGDGQREIAEFLFNRIRELEAENAALRHDLERSMANHVADINVSESDADSANG